MVAGQWSHSNALQCHVPTCLKFVSRATTAGHRRRRDPGSREHRGVVQGSAPELRRGDRHPRRVSAAALRCVRTYICACVCESLLHSGLATASLSTRVESRCVNLLVLSELVFKLLYQLIVLCRWFSVISSHSKHDEVNC